MKLPVFIFLFIFLITGCKTDQSGFAGKKYQYIDRAYTAIYEFDSDTSLTYTFTSMDEPQFITVCDYSIRRDSVFIITSHEQEHKQYLSVSDTLLVSDSNTLFLLSDKVVFKPME